MTDELDFGTKTTLDDVKRKAWAACDTFRGVLDASEALGNRAVARGADAAVALVRADGAGGFAADVESSYRETTGNAGKIYACRAVSGARVIG